MKVMKPIEQFKNGNNLCLLYEDGTSIIKGDQNFKFPLNIDCRISSKCEVGCPMCYENNTKDGKFCDIEKQTWIKSLHKGTEVALNFNGPLDHNNIYRLLSLFKKQGVYSNATVNWKTFIDEWQTLRNLQQEKLLYGIGISLPSIREVPIEQLKYIGNIVRQGLVEHVVYHCIVGLFNVEDYYGYIKNGDLGELDKITLLFLGYKNLGRGINYMKKFPEDIENRINQLGRHLQYMFNEVGTISFDCLAMEQLDIKSMVSKAEYGRNYLGKDGTRSLYIDMVNNQFARSSTEKDKFDIAGKSVEEMFAKIKV